MRKIVLAGILATAAPPALLCMNVQQAIQQQRILVDDALRAAQYKPKLLFKADLGDLDQALGIIIKAIFELLWGGGSVSWGQSVLNATMAAGRKQPPQKENYNKNAGYANALISLVKYAFIEHPDVEIKGPAGDNAPGLALIIGTEFMLRPSTITTYGLDKAIGTAMGGASAQLKRAGETLGIRTGGHLEPKWAGANNTTFPETATTITQMYGKYNKSSSRRQ